MVFSLLDDTTAAGVHGYSINEHDHGVTHCSNNVPCWVEEGDERGDEVGC